MRHSEPDIGADSVKFDGCRACLRGITGLVHLGSRRAMVIKDNDVKRLLLLRHAKSSWDQPDIADAERPLSKRGERSAPLMGQMMAREGFQPDLILCSSAKRTLQTAQRVVAALGSDLAIEELDDLYMATPREILVTIAENAGTAGNVLVIGHNPGLGDLATWLTSDGDSRDLEKLRDKFPTAALAVIDLPIDQWRDFGDTAVDNWSGHLVRFATPREFETEDEEAITAAQ